MKVLASDSHKFALSLCYFLLRRAFAIITPDKTFAIQQGPLIFGWTTSKCGQDCSGGGRFAAYRKGSNLRDQ